MQIRHYAFFSVLQRDKRNSERISEQAREFYGLMFNLKLFLIQLYILGVFGMRGPFLYIRLPLFRKSEVCLRIFFFFFIRLWRITVGSCVLLRVCNGERGLFLSSCLPHLFQLDVSSSSSSSSPHLFCFLLQCMCLCTCVCLGLIMLLVNWFICRMQSLAGTSCMCYKLDLCIYKSHFMSFIQRICLV